MNRSYEIIPCYNTNYYNFYSFYFSQFSKRKKVTRRFMHVPIVNKNLPNPVDNM